MHLLDLPDAVFLDVVVLENAGSPFGVFVVLAEKREFAPTAFRGHAVGRDVDNRLKLHVVVVLAVGKAGAGIAAAIELDQLADTVLADIDAVVAELGRGIGRKKIRRLVPITAIEIIAIGHLEILDLVGVLDQIGLMG